ncbi:hypothetical protein P0R31_21630 [Bradyrhizobium yuanmingense]|uniref:hypothetical protein n=1 Tax=Bradyrhizobium yuanmingense TaxID=108015 RepID=UPI0023BA0B07|nr:hypothetical protein [Bradyrhizobium yuanmingense]MDF0519844.1 hypothetical protein [Bradyrhizobium yuanmingense]
MLIGSEVDVIAKMLCNREAAGQNASNIIHYQAILTARFAGLHQIGIDIPRYRRKVQPWLSWDPANPIPPIWWTAHNKVKHERDTNFWRANQQNTLEAICGLLALLLYWFKDEGHLQPYPELLNFGFPEFLVSHGGQKPPGA